MAMVYRHKINIARSILEMIIFLSLSTLTEAFENERPRCNRSRPRSRRRLTPAPCPSEKLPYCPEGTHVCSCEHTEPEKTECDVPESERKVSADTNNSDTSRQANCKYWFRSNAEASNLPYMEWTCDVCNCPFWEENGCGLPKCEDCGVSVRFANEWPPDYMPISYDLFLDESIPKFYDQLLHDFFGHRPTQWPNGNDYIWYCRNCNTQNSPHEFLCRVCSMPWYGDGDDHRAARIVRKDFRQHDYLSSSEIPLEEYDCSTETCTTDQMGEHVDRSPSPRGLQSYQYGEESTDTSCGSVSDPALLAQSESRRSESSEDEHSWDRRDEVQLERMPTGFERFNGRHGVLMSFSERKQKWLVRIDQDDEVLAALGLGKLPDKDKLVWVEENCLAEAEAL